MLGYGQNAVLFDYRPGVAVEYFQRPEYVQFFLTDYALAKESPLIGRMGTS
jgi:hypothetical protein